MSRWRAYLELARLSNLPTVWTNTLVGLYAGYAAALAASGLIPLRVGPALLVDVLYNGFFLLVALSCLYAAGMVLNDVLDADVDRIERPQRPIPSGRVSPLAARCVAACLLIAGILGLSVYNPLTLASGIILALAIVAYNLLHLRSRWSVLLMGLCRALVYITAALAVPIVSHRTLASYALPPTICVGVYTVLITVVSRAETDRVLGARRWLALFMPAIALAPALFIGPSRDGWMWVVIAAAGLLGWLGRASLHALAAPPRTRQAIMTWLSGLCLIDAFYLTLLGQPEAAGVAAFCFALTALGHRRIVGT